MFQFPGWMEKNSNPGISADTRDASCFKKRSTGKTTECSKHLEHITIEEDIFQNLTDAFFKYLYLKNNLIFSLRPGLGQEGLKENNNNNNNNNNFISS